MKTSIEMVVDDRERSPQVLAALAGMEDVEIAIRRLPLGDYSVDNRLLFERKTLRDFADSVVDGRFFNQMTQLAAGPLKGVLILEGTSRDLKPDGIRREALQGAMITASLILGIPVLRSMAPEETARLMVYAARQTDRAAEGGLHRPGYRPKGKRRRQLYILQGLPGVGPKRASSLLERFGSIQEILNADLEDLSSVDGIGPDTARNIKWSVRETIDRYGWDSLWPPPI